MPTPFNADEQKRLELQWNWAASQASMKTQNWKTGAAKSSSRKSMVIVAVVFVIVALLSVLLRCFDLAFV